MLIEWHLDDPIEDEESGWIEVSFTLDNGERRWCAFTTPRFLQKLLEKDEEPGIREAHMIVVKRLHKSLMTEMLHVLDENGELYAASLPLPSNEGETEGSEEDE